MVGGHLPRLVLIAFALALSGCAGGQATRDLISASVVAVPANQISGRHEIFVATTRHKSERREEVFDGRRSPQVSYAKVDITVPAIHKTGEIERRKKSQPADPSKFMVAESVTAYDESEFAKALRTDIARNGGRALVFIHGYNTAFDGAVYRMTQIVHDAGYEGTPVLFTWASGGRTVDYVYDSNSASAARDALEQTLRLVAKAGAKRIDIIAHSMGNWATMEALRQLAISGDRDLDNKLGDVVLASPDIDVDVFKSQMARYGVPDKPFILFLSSDDRALRISGLIAGSQPRVGDYGDAADLASLGVIAVDLSQINSGDSLNHTKFADNPVLIKMLGERLKHNSRLVTNQEEADQRVASLTHGITGTLTSAAEVIITTPINVVRIAVGQ
ncbi:alpha/beta hydrolase [Mesorhizobium sp. LHD-90]|uniref:alpha/beta hydrolase n=1 Tax=Mesorhizobium sp. LHD-90 TaxID=3071414 RepID=UPI0027DEF93A|nr:alpha/beta hydrolase [Mesorhizobium sp. LHD-90]MDQ6433084.1 alpha/beta hydrolase [Mesorhizobium sp. LHD-90]